MTILYKRPIREVREVGTGAMKEADMRESEAEGREPLCQMMFWP